MGGDDMTDAAATSDCVFIGGTRDGRRLEIPIDQDTVSISHPTEHVNQVCDGKTIPASLYSVEQYHSHRIRGKHGLFKVFAASNMNPDEIVARLIRGYRSMDQYP